MNENLNLIKILEGCPEGTKLYSPLIGDVKFNSISGKYIYVSTMYGNLEAFNKSGIYGNYDGECMLLPSKEQRDWAKFVRFWDKPKVERFDVNTLQPFDKVLMRTNSSCIWEPDFFGYKCDDWIMCVTTGNVECIPYNEETKHLLGTKEDCPEYYKWWEK